MEIDVFFKVLFLLFIIIFLIDYFLIKRRYLKKMSGKKRVRKNKELTEITYLVGKFNLDKSKLPLNKLLIIISLMNAFIISLVAVLVLIIDTYLVIQLLVGFILLLALIYAMYEILGRILLKKGYCKESKKGRGRKNGIQ